MKKYFEGKIHYEISLSISVGRRGEHENHVHKEIITIKDNLYRADSFEGNHNSVSIKTQADCFHIDLEKKRVIDYPEDLTINEDKFNINNLHKTEVILNHLCSQIEIEEKDPEEGPYSQKLFIAKELEINPLLKNRRLLFLSGFIPLKIEHNSNINNHAYHITSIVTKIEKTEIPLSFFDLTEFSPKSYTYMTSIELDALWKKEAEEEEKAHIKKQKEAEERKEREKPFEEAKSNALFKPFISILKKHGIQPTPEMEKEPRLAADLVLNLKKEIKQLVIQDYLDVM